jgi:hypothetical protein
MSHSTTRVTAKAAYSLYTAIKLTQGGNVISSFSTDLPPASTTQVEELVRWYADTMVEKMWAMPHVFAGENLQTSASCYSDDIYSVDLQ